MEQIYFTNADDFANYCRIHLPGLRPVSAAEIREWTKLGLLQGAPPYYRSHLRTVMGLLQVKAPPKLEPQNAGKYSVPSFRGLRQVVSCIGFSPQEMQPVVSRLKETGYVSFAGWVGVNYAPISRQPLEKPGAEWLSITVKVECGAPAPKGVLTPWGYRSLVPKGDSSYITLVSSPGERAIRVMPEQWWVSPPGNRPLERVDYAEYVATPIVVPLLKVDGVGRGLVYLSYVTADGRRIPALAEKPPEKAYRVILNTETNNPREVASVLSRYEIYLRSESKDIGVVEAFHSIREELRRLVEMPRNKLINLAPSGEAGFVNLSLISQLSLIHI